MLVFVFTYWYPSYATIVCGLCYTRAVAVEEGTMSGATECFTDAFSMSLSLHTLPKYIT